MGIKVIRAKGWTNKMKPTNIQSRLQVVWICKCIALVRYLQGAKGIGLDDVEMEIP